MFSKIIHLLPLQVLVCCFYSSFSPSFFFHPTHTVAVGTLKLQKRKIFPHIRMNQLTLFPCTMFVTDFQTNTDIWFKATVFFVCYILHPTYIIIFFKVQTCVENIHQLPFLCLQMISFLSTEHFSAHFDPLLRSLIFSSVSIFFNLLKVLLLLIPMLMLRC